MNSNSETTKIEFSEEAYDAIYDLALLRAAIPIVGRISDERAQKARTILVEIEAGIEKKLVSI